MRAAAQVASAGKHEGARDHNNLRWDGATYVSTTQQPQMAPARKVSSNLEVLKGVIGCVIGGTTLSPTAPTLGLARNEGGETGGEGWGGVPISSQGAASPNEDCECQKLALVLAVKDLQGPWAVRKGGPRCELPNNIA